MEGRERVELIRFQTFTQVVHSGISRLFSAEDGARFAEKFGRERLLEEFARGRHWFYELSQVVDLEGSIQWISVGVNLCPDPESGDICLFAYMSLRNHQHRWETEVQPSAEFDLNTGAYLAESAGRMVRYALQKAGQTLCALAVIHVGGVSTRYLRVRQPPETGYTHRPQRLPRYRQHPLAQGRRYPLRLFPQRRLALHPQAAAGGKTPFPSRASLWRT